MYSLLLGYEAHVPRVPRALSFLQNRCLILELGAALDRIERASDNKAALQDSRHKQLLEGIRLLLESGTGRAENIQNLFSL